MIVIGKKQNRQTNKINKHVHDNEMMNVDLTMTMAPVVVMVNDDVNDYHYVNYDDDHDLVHGRDHLRDLFLDPDLLLNVDFVADIA